MARSLVVTTPFADHGIGDTLTGDAADAALAGPHAAHVVRGPDTDEATAEVLDAPSAPASPVASASV